MQNNTLTVEQQNLLKEFEIYGVEKQDVIFFTEKAEPFFNYETTALLLRQLTDVVSVKIEQKDNFSGTTVMFCELGFESGGTVSAIGVVNHADKINGQIMNEHQQLTLASARAIRNAMRAGGINLLKAHNLMKKTGELTEQGEDELRNKLLGEAHILGEEVGFIVEFGGVKTKSGWYSIIEKRYGKNSSGKLSIEELTDFAAFLRSCLQRAA